MEAFLATCRSALDRMEETPGFVFTCSSAAHYRWVEEVEPELFADIRRRVAERRWVVVGGWWTQADCNLPSGEGFVRQALLGQRYFREKLGHAARTGYSPDAFGHNAGLPQLLRRAGMDGYIFCRPDPTELELPSPLVRWIGPDGSEVLAYRVPLHYNMYETSVPKKVADLEAALDAPSPLAAGGRPLRDFGSEWSLFYGVGNHGGGPTREHIRQILEIAHDTHRPQLLFSDPDRFFDAVKAGREERVTPEWREDLQLDAPGCYSAHAGIKRKNRLVEHHLVAAERIASAAAILTGATYPSAELRAAWEHVCFNHFHDILCGVAIREALDDAMDQYGAAHAAATRAGRYGLQAIARGIDTSGPGSALLVFNPHSWEISDTITFELWHDIDKSLWSQPVHVRVIDQSGADIPCTVGFTSGKIGKDRIAVTLRVTIPALGWSGYRVIYGERAPLDPLQTEPAIVATDTMMENEHLRVEISPESGAILRLHHIASGTELLNGPSALPVAIEDRTDTWGHGAISFDQVVGTFGDAEVRLVEHGPTHATIRAVSRWRGCRVQQEFRLAAASAELSVGVRVFWDADYTMLKLSFATALTGVRSINEGAYCHVEKPCDGTERPCGRWVALAGAVDGLEAALGIASDLVHGFDATDGAKGSDLRLSILRSVPYALHTPHPHHPDEDLEFLDQGTMRFRYTIVPVIGREPAGPMARASALVCQPLLPHLESWHAGSLPRHYSGIDVTPPNVQLAVLKRCEEGREWIVRAHEVEGRAAEGEIALHLLGLRWPIALGPHEVGSWRVGPDGAVPVSLIEGPAFPA